MKVKIIQKYYLNDAEESINEFIKGRKIIDIKVNFDEHKFSYLIIYE